MNADAARAALSNTSTGWSKSSFSNGGQNGCVEFNFDLPGWAGVRDSKLGDASPVLVFNAREIDALIAGMKAGEFDGRM
ncbi:DUF397 domain-containing protein [Prauserella endophytica]|uniref:DUF397 domain-containing protein n=1 Tax=Prauserella endophytica TaxID=1592324 RepID=A0ABY2RV09_9PSEU|nr:DUF397 domain-containing protein [Prauserella endophytica]TKG61530.1 DUF397 domain-containing protein [Prauserella endophytica]